MERGVRKQDARKGNPICAALVVLSLHVLPCPGATLVLSSADGGGGRSGAGNCVNDGSIGGIGGVSSAASGTVRHGYIGQLTEVSGLSVTGAPSSISQSATSQLRGWAILSDGTVTTLTGGDILWDPVSYPLASVSTGGLLTAVANVYASPVGEVSGRYLGVTSNTVIQVLGPYAGGGIPDLWLRQYFGAPPNANAAPTADASGTGQNNLFKYVAGLDPTNPASVFVFRIADVPGQSGQKALTWKPWAPGRTYAPQYRTDLLDGEFASLTGGVGPQTNLDAMTLIDTNAVEPRKFYRINISLP